MRPSTYQFRAGWDSWLLTLPAWFFVLAPLGVHLHDQGEDIKFPPVYHLAIALFWLSFIVGHCLYLRRYRLTVEVAGDGLITLTEHRLRRTLQVQVHPHELEPPTLTRVFQANGSMCQLHLNRPAHASDPSVGATPATSTLGEATPPAGATLSFGRDLGHRGTLRLYRLLRRLSSATSPPDKAPPDPVTEQTIT